MKIPAHFPRGIHNRLLPIATGALMLGASAAHAEVLLHAQNSATITPINAATNLIIGGATTFSFTVPGTSFARVMIVFDSECGVGGATTNRLDLDILLDPAGGTTTFSPIAPGSSSFTTPLCSGDGTASNSDSLITSSMVVVANVPPGTSQLQVRATPTAGSVGPGRIGARTLVVTR